MGSNYTNSTKISVTTVPTTQTTISPTVQTATNVTGSPIVTVFTTTTPASDDQTEIIAIAVPIGIILSLVVIGAIVFYMRRRKTLKDKGQRLPIKGPDYQINQNERDRPPLDVPLSTYEVINSGANSPIYNNYSGLNPDSGVESNSRSRADSQSELYENTKQNSTVSPAESKTALVPKGWAVKPGKPSQAADPLPKTSGHPQVLKPSGSPKPKKPPKQDSTETPYYITVFPDPPNNSVAAHNDQGKTNNKTNAAFSKTPKSKNKDKKKMHKQDPVDVASPKKQSAVREESTLSTNYYNIEDDNSYQNVDVKLNK